MSLSLRQLKWVEDAKELADQLFRFEENWFGTEIGQELPPCPLCGSTDHDEDDGSYIHDIDCPFELAHQLLNSHYGAFVYEPPLPSFPLDTWR